MAVLAEWERKCEGCAGAIRELLRPTGDLATSYPAPWPGRPPLRVVRHADGSFVAVCDEGRSDRLTLAAPDIALYGVDLASLRSRACDALRIRTARDRQEPLPGALPVGAWEPKPSVRVPVVLLVACDKHAVGIALHEVMLAGPKALLDALDHAGVYHDDAQIDRFVLERGEVVPLGGVTVEITERAA